MAGNQHFLQKQDCDEQENREGKGPQCCEGTMGSREWARS